MPQERMQGLMEMKHRVTSLLTEYQPCLSAQVTLLSLPTFTHLYNDRVNHLQQKVSESGPPEQFKRAEITPIIHKTTTPAALLL